jgi:hypothetical protein
MRILLSVKGSLTEHSQGLRKRHLSVVFGQKTTREFSKTMLSMPPAQGGRKRLRKRKNKLYLTQYERIEQVERNQAKF